MAGQKPIQQIVKALSWQLLYSNYAKKLGLEGWRKLADQVGAPDFRHMDQDEDTPMAPFNQAVLYINEIPDRPWDTRSGKRTLVVRLPIKTALQGYSVLITATYATILVGAVSNVMPLATLMALATVPLAWNAVKVLLKNYQFPYRLIPANANTIFVHLLTGLLLFYAYIAAGLLHA